MTEYRVGRHWGVTIVAEGTQPPDANGKRPDFDAKVAAGLITWLNAEVIPWPGLRQAHADDLAEQERADNA